ncbi:RNA methyltransferase [Cyanobium sp. CH-040]|uniref:RNA methyltransferase n=1 Tax=Cyanobium sp. CH-040 TaxID=2823708 RepID=UPI0020CCF145|nr:RNA methyltransferase [Cyanobium sp. CH-040]
MALPEQLLLSDLLKRRVRDQEGLERGTGVAVWMHPPVHRVLGWASRPSMFGTRRLVWRLNQLAGLLELEALVKGEPADTDQATLERLPTLIDAALLDRDRQPIGTVADAAIDLRSGAIRHYLVSRSDPRLPGSSRWRLSPDRIVDQQPGLVSTALSGLDDLPLARASVRQDLLRRSRRWREQVQQAGERLESRVEGWLEEPPWDDSDGVEEEPVDWRQSDDAPPGPEPWDEEDWDWETAEPPPDHPRRSRRPRQDPLPRGGSYDGDDDDGDPWI